MLYYRDKDGRKHKILNGDLLQYPKGSIKYERMISRYWAADVKRAVAKIEYVLNPSIHTDPGDVTVEGVVRATTGVFLSGFYALGHYRHLTSVHNALSCKLSQMQKVIESKSNSNTEKRADIQAIDNIWMKLQTVHRFNKIRGVLDHYQHSDPLQSTCSDIQKELDALQSNTDLHSTVHTNTYNRVKVSTPGFNTIYISFLIPSVTLTDPVYDKKVNLGDIVVVLNIRRSMIHDVLVLAYRAKKSSPFDTCKSSPNVVHPHVSSDNALCLGTLTKHRVLKLLEACNFEVLLESFDVLLRDYNPSDCYFRLQLWHGTDLAQCGCGVWITASTSQCAICGDHICPSCRLTDRRGRKVCRRHVMPAGEFHKGKGMLVKGLWTGLYLYRHEVWYIYNRDKVVFFDEPCMVEKYKVTCNKCGTPYLKGDLYVGGLCYACKIEKSMEELKVAKKKPKVVPTAPPTCGIAEIDALLDIVAVDN